MSRNTRVDYFNLTGYLPVISAPINGRWYAGDTGTYLNREETINLMVKLGVERAALERADFAPLDKAKVIAQQESITITPTKTIIEDRSLVEHIKSIPTNILVVGKTEDTATQTNLKTGTTTSFNEGAGRSEPIPETRKDVVAIAVIQKDPEGFTDVGKVTVPSVEDTEEKAVTGVRDKPGVAIVGIVFVGIAVLWYFLFAGQKA